MSSVGVAVDDEGQAQVWHFIFGFADSMALKCAVELHIPDIIHSHSQPITISQIASSLHHDPTNTSRPDTAYLARIMRLLVRRKIFTAERKPSDGGDGETLYGPTRYSKWLVSDSEMSLAPLLLMQNHPWLLAPWHCFSRCVTEGGVAFEKAHGRNIWEFASENPEFNQIFNGAMACTSKIVLKAVVEAYGREGFGSVGSVVDVGGGTGTAVAEIVKAFPKVQGINFDLPHVVATAPPHVGVSHVGGDMFETIPPADVAFFKFIMHDWNDEDCVKILKNCRKAIPEKTGKVVIVDVVLRPDGNERFDDLGFIFDLVMIAHASGGKERSEVEWKNILDKSGFPTYKIINIPALPCIIEAYPNPNPIPPMSHN